MQTKLNAQVFCEGLDDSFGLGKHYIERTLGHITILDEQRPLQKGLG
jgi:hypothetical protein